MSSHATDAHLLSYLVDGKSLLMQFKDTVLVDCCLATPITLVVLETQPVSQAALPYCLTHILAVQD